MKKQYLTTDSEYWEKAMEEMKALKDNDTYELTPVPKYEAILGRNGFFTNN